MQKNIIAFETFHDSEIVSNNFLFEINGGSIWGEIAFIAGRTLKCIYQFGQDAGAYQHSLPPSLKK